jgi:peptidylprolyl isomerase
MQILPLFSLIAICAGLACFSAFAQDAADYDFPADPVMIFETTQGSFEIRLYPEVAPLACENFIRLAQQQYYDGIVFHRIIKDFMIQGGDPTGTGRGGDSIWKKSFKDEFSSDYTFDRPGILAMANSGPSSNGSQFFITTVATPWLDHKHTIFGEVVEGMNIVKKMENVSTSYGDKPVETQKIKRVYLKK